MKRNVPTTAQVGSFVYLLLKIGILQAEPNFNREVHTQYHDKEIPHSTRCDDSHLLVNISDLGHSDNGGRSSREHGELDPKLIPRHVTVHSLGKAEQDRTGGASGVHQSRSKSGRRHRRRQQRSDVQRPNTYDIVVGSQLSLCISSIGTCVLDPLAARAACPPSCPLHD